MESEVQRLTKQQIRNRKKWAKALRSGKYKQGKGALVEYDEKGSPSYCCLGVAREVGLAPQSYDLTSVLDKNDMAGLVPHGYWIAECGDGLVDEDGNDASLSFVAMNDLLDFTFDEIADCLDLDTWYRQEEGT